MNSNRVRVGIIGAGTVVVERHIPAYLRDKRCEIKAIVSRRVERAKEVAKKFSIPKYYDNIDDFLKNKFDIIDICTPPFTHHELAIRCMEICSGLLIEKPIAMNAEEARDIVLKSQKHGVKLCVVHNYLFSNSIRRLKLMTSKAQLGNIHSIRAIQIGNLKRKIPSWCYSLPGRIFFDESIHILYLLESFMPSIEITFVSHIYKEGKDRIDIYLTSKSSDSERVNAWYTSDFSCNWNQWTMEIIFDKALVFFDLFKDTLIVWRGAEHNKPHEVLRTSLKRILDEVGQLLTAGWRYLRGLHLFGHDKLLSSFITSVIKDEDPPVKPEKAVRVMELMDEILKKLNLKEKQINIT